MSNPKAQIPSEESHSKGNPQSPSPSLGVVAISYNEERDLPGFLHCLLHWVGEIVIVDDGSNDRTAEIARAAGSKVVFIQSKRKGGEYYADQRNKGIDAATSDWLLHMDIDERVPPDLAAEIFEAIKNPAMDGYRFRRLNYFLHRPVRGGGWQDWNLVHLARREKLRFEGMFHEHCRIDAPPKRIGQLRETMVHLNDDSYAERLRKSDNYLPEVVARIEEKQAKIGAIDITWRPVREFLYKYFYKKGYRDGVPGLILAMHSACAILRANALVWDKQNHITREEVERELAKTRISAGIVIK